jgi:uncharacterized RDD family membrane protein YckC
MSEVPEPAILTDKVEGPPSDEVTAKTTVVVEPTVEAKAETGELPVAARESIRDLPLAEARSPKPEAPAKPADPPLAKVQSPKPKAPSPSSPRPLRREAQAVFVVGFWRRAVAAAVDAFVIIPVALLVTLVVSRLAGIHMPPSNLHPSDIDLWIDLVLASDPALMMGAILAVAIALTYSLVFQVLLGRTLGMRLLKMRIIDVYGDRPSPARCAIRCVGYVVGLATLFLGFLWVGFDSEKRGLHDWLAGTYVIRA